MYVCVFLQRNGLLLLKKWVAVVRKWVAVEKSMYNSLSSNARVLLVTVV